MSYPRYLEYKDSGVEWLGEVPKHWEMKRIGHFATSTGGGTPARDKLEFWGGAIPWITPKDMKTEFLHESEETITKSGMANSAASVIGPNRVLIVMRSGILRRYIPVGVNLVATTVNQDMRAIDVSRELIPTFFMRLVQGLNRELLLAWSKQGATVESLESDLLFRTWIPIPPRTEQEAILDFLDRETSKMDTLVAEQEKLIALLKEKRQSVISHVVTKGLDPTVPMKDSGIEWLGEVPEHWGFWKLKHLTNSIIDAEHKTAPYFDDGQYLVVRTTNIKSGRLVLEDAKYTDLKTYTDWTRRGLPEPGDILFTREAPAGEACKVPDNIPVCLGQRTVLVKINQSLSNTDFVIGSLYHGPASVYISMLSQGSTVSHLNMGDIINIPILLPPLSEQIEIAAFLDCETTKIDTLITEAQHAITLLKERRTALISAAVTGKIDVRVPVREVVTV